jgi:hypothetical protein
MSLTQHIGYGRYCLEDFLPGELFARYDSSLALVCDPQPAPPPKDQIQVWVDHGTSNQRKVGDGVGQGRAVEHEEQAWMIERRRKDVQNGQPLFWE